MSAKNVLVTGGCGFIGSHFLNYMVMNYPNINFYNIDSLNYCADINNVIVQHCDNYHFTCAKLQNQATILDFIVTNNIECVVHFAAQSHVDNSFNDSLVFTDDNIVATHVLLECCRLAQEQYNIQIQRFIHISTDEVYGETSTCKTENCLLNPTNPYAATKAAAEMICKSYFHSHKLPVIITRSNNVYGPRQYKEKLIPKFISLLLNNKKCTIHGDGEYKRSFLHVHDVCTAIEIILLHGQVGETYNIGSNEEYTVNQIADIIIKFLKPNSNPEHCKEHVQDRLFNDTRYLISSEKLRSLGWKQTIPFLNQGIESTIRWYKQQYLKICHL